MLFSTLFCTFNHSVSVYSSFSADYGSDLSVSVPLRTFGVGVGEEAVPRHFAAQRQRQQVVPGLDVDDAVEILLRGRAQDA